MHFDSSMFGNYMTIKSEIAIATAKAAKSVISSLTSRSGGSMPGAIAMKIDSNVLSTLTDRIRGSICITGTNGKTSTTNLIADAISAMESNIHGDEAIGVVSNRDGDNMDMGIVTAMSSQTSRIMKTLDDNMKPYAVLECDELFTKRVLPRLHPNALLLLNLFRDQLDRYGEIDRTQKAIETALKSSPDTILVYNADDPLCSMIAESVSDTNRCVPFSCMLERTDEDLLDNSGSASDSRLCPHCGMPLDYSNVAYGQIGNYWCPSCDWKPSEPASNHMFRVIDVPSSDNGDAEEHRIFIGCATGNGSSESYIACSPDGLYMDYNVAAAACIVSIIAPIAFPSLSSCDDRITNKAVHDAIQDAVSKQKCIGGRGGSWLVRNGDDEVLVRTKLAKNPTGFNRMLQESSRRKSDAILFLLNDEDPDGHDVSWIWDIDFEGTSIDTSIVMTGGERSHDMALRAIYAGYDAVSIDGGIEVAIEKCLNLLGTGTVITVIANYTSFCQTVRMLHSNGAEEISPNSEPLWADRTVIDDGLDEQVGSLFNAMMNGRRPVNVAPEFAMAMKNAFIEPFESNEENGAGTNRIDSFTKIDNAINSANDNSDNTQGIVLDSDAHSDCGENNDTRNTEYIDQLLSVKAFDIDLDEAIDNRRNSSKAITMTGIDSLKDRKSLTITWLYPDAMNLYGDRGNAICLRRRIEATGIECIYDEIGLGDDIDLSNTDICLIGGGSDRDQKTVMRHASRPDNKQEIRRYIENGGVMLTICGGYQMLGDSYVDAAGDMQSGLGIINGMTTTASIDGSRFIGNTAVKIDALSIDFDEREAIGFENHGGRTNLPDTDDVRPFGKTLTNTGNNGKDGSEGVRYINTIGTYLHGCLLPKNPAIADWLIATAYEKKYHHQLMMQWDNDCPICREEQAARKIAIALVHDRKTR